MYSVLSLIEGLNVQFYEIGHDIIEHKEACCFIDHLFLACVDQIEDGSQYFIHSLDVCSFGVQFGIDEEDARHIIISVCLSLLLFILQPCLHDIWTLAMYHFISLFAGLCGKGYLHGLNFFRKEGKV